MIFCINFDEKYILPTASSQPVPFADAIAQGLTTQASIDEQERQMMQCAIFDLENAGYKDVTDEINKRDGTSYLYVFADPNGHILHHCKTADDVFDLEENGYVA